MQIDDKAIDAKIVDNLGRAVDIYDRAFIRGEKPTERNVVALIALTLTLEEARISHAVQIEALLGAVRALELKVDLLK